MLSFQKLLPNPKNQKFLGMEFVFLPNLASDNYVFY